MRIFFRILKFSAVLLFLGLLSIPAQAEEQRGKQRDAQQEGNNETRDARDDKESTSQDKGTRPARGTSGLKDTSQQQGASKSQNKKDSRDARDDKEAGGSSHK